MFAIFPEILNQTAAGDIEAVTCLVRKYFADGQIYSPNLRVAELCANAEIKIRTASMNSAARMEAWDANGQFRIEISLHPEIRNHRELNYILASMLGHVFLELQPKMANGELQRSIFEKSQSPLREVLLNQNAATAIDHFACSLLLPKAMVKKAMSSLASRQDVAAFFNVDLPLLEFRLAKLGFMQGASAEVAHAKAKTKEPIHTANSEVAATKTKDLRGKTMQPRDVSLPKKEEKTKPNPTQEDLSSMARVNRSTAARSYRKEGEQKTEVRKSSPKNGEAPASPGLERLRQLARKIDKSVSD